MTGICLEWNSFCWHRGTSRRTAGYFKAPLTVFVALATAALSHAARTCLYSMEGYFQGLFIDTKVYSGSAASQLFDPRNSQLQDKWMRYFPRDGVFNVLPAWKNFDGYQNRYGFLSQTGAECTLAGALGWTASNVYGVSKELTNLRQGASCLPVAGKFVASSNKIRLAQKYDTLQDCAHAVLEKYPTAYGAEREGWPWRSATSSRNVDCYAITARSEFTAGTPDQGVSCQFGMNAVPGLGMSTVKTNVGVASSLQACFDAVLANREVAGFTAVSWHRKDLSCVALRKIENFNMSDSDWSTAFIWNPTIPQSTTTSTAAIITIAPAVITTPAAHSGSNSTVSVGVIIGAVGGVALISIVVSGAFWYYNRRSNLDEQMSFGEAGGDPFGAGPNNYADPPGYGGGFSPQAQYQGAWQNAGGAGGYAHGY